MRVFHVRDYVGQSVKQVRNVWTCGECESSITRSTAEQEEKKYELELRQEAKTIKREETRVREEAVREKRRHCEAVESFLMLLLLLLSLSLFKKLGKG